MDTESTTHSIQRVELPIVGSSDLFLCIRCIALVEIMQTMRLKWVTIPKRTPFFFIKPPYALLPEGGRLQYPSLTSDLHHEIELVVALVRVAPISA